MLAPGRCQDVVPVAGSTAGLTIRGVTWSALLIDRTTNGWYSGPQQNCSFFEPSIGIDGNYCSRYRWLSLTPQELCCWCGGGHVSAAPSPPPPSIPPVAPSVCSPNVAVDVTPTHWHLMFRTGSGWAVGYRDCGFFSSEAAPPNACALYTWQGADPNNLCCACGGGLLIQLPVMPPLPPAHPSPPPSPLPPLPPAPSLAMAPRAVEGSPPASTGATGSSTGPIEGNPGSSSVEDGTERGVSLTIFEGVLIGVGGAALLLCAVLALRLAAFRGRGVSAPPPSVDGTKPWRLLVPGAPSSSSGLWSWACCWPCCSSVPVTSGHGDVPSPTVVTATPIEAARISVSSGAVAAAVGEDGIIRGQPLMRVVGRCSNSCSLACERDTRDDSSARSSTHAAYVGARDHPSCHEHHEHLHLRLQQEHLQYQHQLEALADRQRHQPQQPLRHSSSSPCSSTFNRHRAADGAPLRHPLEQHGLRDLARDASGGSGSGGSSAIERARLSSQSGRGLTTSGTSGPPRSDRPFPKSTSDDRLQRASYPRRPLSPPPASHSEDASPKVPRCSEYGAPVVPGGGSMGCGGSTSCGTGEAGMAAAGATVPHQPRLGGGGRRYGSAPVLDLTRIAQRIDANPRSDLFTLAEQGVGRAMAMEAHARTRSHAAHIDGEDGYMDDDGSSVSSRVSSTRSIGFGYPCGRGRKAKAYMGQLIDVSNNGGGASGGESIASPSSSMCSSAFGGGAGGGGGLPSSSRCDKRRPHRLDLRPRGRHGDGSSSGSWALADGAAQHRPAVESDSETSVGSARSLSSQQQRMQQRRLNQLSSITRAHCVGRSLGGRARGKVGPSRAKVGIGVGVGPTTATANGVASMTQAVGTPCEGDDISPPDGNGLSIESSPVTGMGGNGSIPLMPPSVAASSPPANPVMPHLFESPPMCDASHRDERSEVELTAARLSLDESIRQAREEEQRLERCKSFEVARKWITSMETEYDTVEHAWWFEHTVRASGAPDSAETEVAEGSSAGAHDGTERSDAPPPPGSPSHAPSPKRDISVVHSMDRVTEQKVLTPPSAASSGASSGCETRTVSSQCGSRGTCKAPPRLDARLRTASSSFLQLRSRMESWSDDPNVTCVT